MATHQNLQGERAWQRPIRCDSYTIFPHPTIERRQAQHLPECHRSEASKPSQKRTSRIQVLEKIFDPRRWRAAAAFLGACDYRKQWFCLLSKTVVLIHPSLCFLSLPRHMKMPQMALKKRHNRDTDMLTSQWRRGLSHLYRNCSNYRRI